MSQSLRQKPPKDRSAAYAALIVAGLLLAGCVGWMANSMINGDGKTKKESAKQLAREDFKSKEDANIRSDLSDAEAKDSNLQKGDPLDGTASGKREKVSNANRDMRKVTDIIGSEAKVDPNQLEQERVKGPPKLSELDSYKKSPNKTRVKAPKTKRVNSTNGNRSNASKGFDQKTNSKSTTDKTDSALSQQNQFAIEQSTSDLVFFQEIIVDRNPVFGIEGITELNQKFKYRAVSRITVHPGRNGFRKVSQKVVASNLISADSISKKSIEESVKKLVGKEFLFTLDKKQKVVDFRGEKDPPKSVDFKDLTSIEGFKGDGFMVSSVMDLDGWKEMAQLTFLLPDDKKKKWSDQMEHDWGELGRWVGETRFEKKGDENDKLRIDYAHFMRYEPAAEGKSKLPFKLGSISMESKEAGGRLFFDRAQRRIDSLIERFQVTGSIDASLFGGSGTKFKIQETQTFELKLHDQNPQ